MSTNSELNHDQQLKILFADSVNKEVQIKDDIPYPSKLILSENKFLRFLIKAVTIGIVAVAIAAAVATLGFVDVSGREPITLTYGLDEEGRVVQIQPIGQYGLTEEDVLVFAVDMVKRLHKLSFTDYIDYIDELEHDFVNYAAWEEYQRALLQSKTLERINDSNQTSWAEPISAPIVTAYDEESGRWVVEVKFRWFLGGGSFSTTGSDNKALLQIKKVPRSKNLRALAVEKYLVKPLGGV